MISRTLAVLSAAVLLALPATSTLRAAPAELAAIAVSLTVQETCLVQSADAAISQANQPVVSCLHGAPFEITQVGLDPATSGAGANSNASNAANAANPANATNASRGAAQPVAFVASRDAQQTVWTVNF
ncbi:hypothetical protein LFL96_05360 [Paraburkholderia sp. D15]|uniref:hypothetical protein n=1 Tax=Paraburkholderia sp. D15 TaxID=2880218 RepID=UPI002478CEEE|nr:hypothetical protein [Paraburkholderia sp. D15]WGS50934.1 hypothetical protein LFL96_05360 [Paraburkholderia sp. D15]WKF58911.1 hypothetical protein HUO10_003413 [Paraburkholderia busanensis]